MKAINLNGIDFNAESAASMDEAAFIAEHTELATQIWYRENAEDVKQRLSVAHKLSVDLMAEPNTAPTVAPKPENDDNSSRTTEQIQGSGSGGSDGGSGDGEPADASRSQPRTANRRGNQNRGEDRAV